MRIKIIILIIFVSMFLSSCIISIDNDTFLGSSIYTGYWYGYLSGEDNVHGNSIIIIGSDGTIRFQNYYNLTVDFYRYDIVHKNIFGNDVYEAAKYVYINGDSVTYYLTIEFIESSYNASIYIANVSLVEKRSIVSDKIYRGIFYRY